MVLFPTAVLALSSAVLCAAQNATNNDFPVNAQNFTSAQYNLSTVDIQYQVWLGCGPADNLTTVNRRVSYFIVGGLAIIDGDIVYGTEDDILNDIVSTNPPTVARDEELRPDKRALSTRNQNERWPNAVVPYAWGNIVEPPDTNPPTPPLTDQDVSDRKAMFQRAAQVWMDKLPWLKIQLVDDPFPTDAAPAAGIRIDFLTGCVSWSPVGRKPAQVDSVVSIGCPSLNVYVHELGHTLGMAHEHQRPDRDKYFDLYCERVDVDANGIEPKCTPDCAGYGCNFLTVNDPGWNFEGPYDTSSVMHYYEGTFAANWNNPPLVGINGVRVTTGEKPSLMDLVRICEMYADQCRGICGDGIFSPWNDEECDPGCEGVETSSCTENCKKKPVCGNGIVETGEECDDGPTGSVTCTSTCHAIHCIETCNPDPNFNHCDITTSCITLEGPVMPENQGTHYCACRHGFKAPDGVDQMRLPWYSPISQEGRVFVPPYQACNELCDDWTLGRDGCKEIDERPLCY